MSHACFLSSLLQLPSPLACSCLALINVLARCLFVCVGGSWVPFPPSSVGSYVPFLWLLKMSSCRWWALRPSLASLVFLSRLWSLSVFLPPLGIDCSSSCFPRSALWPSVTSTHMCSFFSSSSSSSSFIFSYRFLWHMFHWHLHMFLLRSEYQLHWLVWRRRTLIVICTPTDDPPPNHDWKQSSFLEAVPPACHVSSAGACFAFCCHNHSTEQLKPHAFYFVLLVPCSHRTR